MTNTAYWICKAIKNRAERQEISIGHVKVYGKNDSKSRKIVISLDDCDDGRNILGIIKTIVDDLQEEFGVELTPRFLEI